MDLLSHTFTIGCRGAVVLAKDYRDLNLWFFGKPILHICINIHQVNQHGKKSDFIQFCISNTDIYNWWTNIKLLVSFDSIERGV